ncbi:hypothetical protein BMF94_0289 [Rhodotorula taiwanensis]|uniref:Cyclin-like domain-containing protein n=1 Tax=Rhodotorula taiwanensis TaxID=741276 RepID=A0A2S5BIV4_9BASI|nr:hypothetical protein BMF94_0289 [Rhodotorula taiwanensis]
MSLLGVPPPELELASTPAPLAVVRQYRAYYSPVELSHLVHLQALHPGQPHKHLSDHRIHLYRQLAAGYIERVANRLGLQVPSSLLALDFVKLTYSPHSPRRTIATAQKLYHRFHLHFPLVEFPYQDVSLAALLVASKLEDTLKKLRDIQVAAWQVQNLLDGGNGAGEGDPAAQEAHRPHLIGIERLILQTICFNLNLHRPLTAPASSTAAATPLSGTLNDDPLTGAGAGRDPDADSILAAASSLTTGDAFRTLFRLGAALPSLPLPLTAVAVPPTSSSEEPALKLLTRLAFLLLTDVHRTLAPLSFPPHTCAAACLWLAGYLLGAALATGRGGLEGADGRGDDEEEEPPVWEPEMEQRWAATCESDPRDLGEIAQTLLDLLISLCPPPPLSSSLTQSGNASTGSPHSSLASPSEPASANLATVAAAAGGSKPNPSATSITSDREKHLLAAGCPNAFSHPALMPSPSSSSAAAAGLSSTLGRNAAMGGAGIGTTKYLGVDELMRVKIRVRKASKRLEVEAVQEGASSGEKRPREPASTTTGPDSAIKTNVAAAAAAADEDESTVALKRSRRWTNVDAGLADVGRIRDERDLKDRIRAEERAERQQLKEADANSGLAASSTGGEGENGAQVAQVAQAATMSGMTEEEREKERRERRERLKPGSVRYRF